MPGKPTMAQVRSTPTASIPMLVGVQTGEQMNARTSKARRGGHALALIGLIATLTASSSSAVHADSDGSPGVVGAWQVQVTLRDCATNAPLGTFSSLVSFHRGGSLSESAASLAFAPGQRSPGHGTWARRRDHTFRQKMIGLILFDTAPNLPGTPGFDPSLPISPGFFAGWQTVSHKVELADANHLTSAGTNAFYKSDGSLYRTGCSSATGQRFN
jgi:hypothetical protein